MTKINLVLLLAVSLLTLSSCAAIGGIFKAGVWVGIFLVVIVVIVLLLIFRKRD